MSKHEKLKNTLDMLDDARLKYAIDFLQNDGEVQPQSQPEKVSKWAYAIMAVVAFTAIVLIGINIMWESPVLDIVGTVDDKYTFIENVQESSEIPETTIAPTIDVPPGELPGSYVLPTIENYSAGKDLCELDMSEVGNNLRVSYDNVGKPIYLVEIRDGFKIYYAYTYDEDERLIKEYGKMIALMYGEASDMNGNAPRDMVIEWVTEYSYIRDCVIAKTTSTYAPESICEMHFDSSGKLVDSIRDNEYTFYPELVNENILAVYMKNQNTADGLDMLIITDSIGNLLYSMSYEAGSGAQGYDDIKTLVTECIWSNSDYLIDLLKMRLGGPLRTFENGAVSSFEYTFGSHRSNKLKLWRSNFGDCFNMDVNIYNPRQQQQVPLFQGRYFYSRTVENVDMKFSSLYGKPLTSIDLIGTEVEGEKIQVDFEHIFEVRSSTITTFIAEVTNTLEKKDEKPSLSAEDSMISVRVDNAYPVSEYEYHIEATVSNETQMPIYVEFMVPYINNVAYSEAPLEDINLSANEKDVKISFNVHYSLENPLGIKEREYTDFSNIMLFVKVWGESNLYDTLKLQIVKDNDNIGDDRYIYDENPGACKIAENKIVKAYITNVYGPGDWGDFTIPEDTIAFKFYIENTSNQPLRFRTNHTTWIQKENRFGALPIEMETNTLEPGMGQYRIFVLQNIDMEIFKMESYLEVVSQMADIVMDGVYFKYPQEWSE